jgi:hypothetical protein
MVEEAERGPKRAYRPAVGIAKCRRTEILAVEENACRKYSAARR